jgi:hypothetical protein
MVVLDAQTHFFHGVISEQPNQVVDRFRLISLFSQLITEETFQLSSRSPTDRMNQGPCWSQECNQVMFEGACRSYDHGEMCSLLVQLNFFR